MDSRDRLFLYTLLTHDTRPIRAYTIFQVVVSAVLLLGLLIIFIFYSLSQFNPPAYVDNPPAYETMSVDNRRCWCLNWVDLWDQISQELEIDFTYLTQDSYRESQGRHLLSQDGENGILEFSTIAKSDFSKALADHPEWVGNVVGIHLYLEGLSRQQSAKYIECIANILNPDSGSAVVQKLKILSHYPPTRDKKVIVGNVSYSYSPSSDSVSIWIAENG